MIVARLSLVCGVVGLAIQNLRQLRKRSTECCSFKAIPVALYLVLFTGVSIFIGDSYFFYAYLTPDDFSARVSPEGLNIDARRNIGIALHFPAMIALLWLDVHIGLLWYENAKKVEMLNGNLRNPTLNRIKCGLKLRLVVIFLLIAVLLQNDFGPFLPAIIATEGIIINLCVNCIATRKLLRLLKGIEKSVIKTKPYRMVRQVATINFICLIFALIGIVVYAFGVTRSAEDLFNDGAFNNVFNGYHIVLFAATINLAANQRYIHQSVQGMAEFHTPRMRHRRSSNPEGTSVVVNTTVVMTSKNPGFASRTVTEEDL